ncbi:AraC family transcriptional regulator [Sediminicola sp. 1XM1-17]|uniref:AraC family transcriptional regulator n=1 Tax=Sediminicola sp. 1XM1-17 TaxID=3127702 RepID=UPI003077F8B2
MKKFFLVLLSLCIVGIVWYLFFYPYDYLVTIKAKANPGTINQTIKLWNSTLDKAELNEGKELAQLNQTLHFNDTTHLYAWEIDAVNDSVSKIKIFAKDSAHSFINKIRIPFTKTDFEKRTVKTLADFNEKLHEHIKNIRVSVVGEDEISATYYAYVKVKTSQFGKAGGMMRNFPLLDPYLVNNGATLKGRPFIEITKWDMQKDSIEYNFGYPVIKSDSLPEHPELHYGYRKSRKALKAIYNGNYITSDRAWYALLDYAKSKDIEVTGLPMEIFFNNPNMGGDELNWTAEIYMPLSKQ